MDSKESLYFVKPRINPFIYIIFIALLILIVYYMFHIQVYNTKEIVGINECNNNSCQIKFTLTYDETDVLNKKPQISYLGKTYQIEQISYEEPYLSNGIPVEDIAIKTSLQSDDKMLSIKLIYQKQRIIDLLKSKIIERK